MEPRLEASRELLSGERTHSTQRKLTRGALSSSRKHSLASPLESSIQNRCMPLRLEDVEVLDAYLHVILFQINRNLETPLNPNDSSVQCKLHLK